MALLVFGGKPEPPLLLATHVGAATPPTPETSCNPLSTNTRLLAGIACGLPCLHLSHRA